MTVDILMLLSLPIWVALFGIIIILGFIYFLLIDIKRLLRNIVENLD